MTIAAMNATNTARRFRDLTRLLPSLVRSSVLPVITATLSAALGVQLFPCVKPRGRPRHPGDLAFEHLARGAVVTSLGGRPVLVCSREDLIAMKCAAGHSQDLLDLEQLGAS
jgi:hypothetical protein